MSVKKVLKEIKTFFKKNQNPELVKKYSRFFREGYDAYGIDQKIFEAFRKELINKYKEELGFEGFLELGSELVKSGKYEEASLAVTFPVFFKDELRKINLKTFESWLDNGICNWAHVDVFCGEVMKILITNGGINIKDIAHWKNSKTKWTRRAVPVSMLHLLKGKNEYKELLEFIAPLMHDEERVVQQGLGWFLREAWKIKPKPVESFLLKYKNSSPRLIFQYATEKMTKEEKLKFKAEKKKN